MVCRMTLKLTVKLHPFLNVTPPSEKSGSTSWCHVSSLAFKINLQYIPQRKNKEV